MNKLHFFIDEVSGVLKVITDIPEEPIKANFQYELPYCKAVKKYQSALKAAKEKALEVLNQDEVEKAIESSKLVFQADAMNPGIIYSLDCNIEVKVHCDQYHQHTKQSCKLAVITFPSKSEDKEPITRLSVSNSKVYVRTETDNILCADQFQASALLYQHHGIEVGLDNPGLDYSYPINGLSYYVIPVQTARILATGDDHKYMPIKGDVAVLEYKQSIPPLPVEDKEELLEALKSVMGMWQIANKAHYDRNSDAVTKFIGIIKKHYPVNS